MILTVLTIGGTILGATTIAGFLMLYQIRQATDFANSGKAIFAADTGIECAFYQMFKGDTQCPSVSPLSNGATFTASCYDASGHEISCNQSSTVASIRSVGTSANSSRAFEASF